LSQKGRKALKESRRIIKGKTIKGKMTRAPLLKAPAKTIRSGREVDVEAEATEEEIVEATVVTETEIEMVTNEKKTAGKSQDIKSKIKVGKLTIRLKKRTNNRMTMKENINVRSLVSSEVVNVKAEAAEASAVEEITSRNTETLATDNMTKRKSNIKKSKRIDMKRAVK